MISSFSPIVAGNLVHFLLWIGDSGLTTLVAGTVVLSLAVAKKTQELALRWAVAFTGLTALVFATKLGLFGWGKGFASLDFRGPSGHASLSAFVWPMVASLLTTHTNIHVRRLALFVSAVAALGTAWILVAHAFHSVAEVAAGSILGALGTTACIWGSRSGPRPSRHVVWAAGFAIFMLFIVQHGESFAPLTRLQIKAHQMVT